MKKAHLFSFLVILISISWTLSGQEMTFVHEEVWQLEEQRLDYVKARDIENFRAMYHPDFTGWPNRLSTPIRQSEIGKRILEAAAEGRKPPFVKIRRESIQNFGNVVVVHFAQERIWIDENGKSQGVGDWIKVTHTWMRVGDSWKIVGGMSAFLESEDN